MIDETKYAERRIRSVNKFGYSYVHSSLQGWKEQSAGFKVIENNFLKDELQKQITREEQLYSSLKLQGDFNQKKESFKNLFIQDEIFQIGNKFMEEIYKNLQNLKLEVNSQSNKKTLDTIFSEFLDNTDKINQMIKKTENKNFPMFLSNQKNRDEMKEKISSFLRGNIQLFTGDTKEYFVDLAVKNIVSEISGATVSIVGTGYQKLSNSNTNKRAKADILLSIPDKDGLFKNYGISVKSAKGSKTSILETNIGSLSNSFTGNLKVDSRMNQIEWYLMNYIRFKLFPNPGNSVGLITSQNDKFIKSFLDLIFIQAIGTDDADIYDALYGHTDFLVVKNKVITKSELLYNLNNLKKTNEMQKYGAMDISSKSYDSDYFDRSKIRYYKFGRDRKTFYSKSKEFRQLLRALDLTFRLNAGAKQSIEIPINI